MATGDIYVYFRHLMKPKDTNQRKHISIDIRPAAAADLDGIEKLERASFGDQAWPREIIDAYLQASLESPERVPLFVAFARASSGETKIAGYTIGCIGGKDSGMVLDLAVSPEFKGRHLGRDLLARVSDSLTKGGADNLTLEVETTNKAAITLYESVGFVKDHVMPDYYGKTRDAYWMKKPGSKPPISPP